MKLVTFLIPIIAFFIFLSIKLLLPHVYVLLIVEDSFIEYMQALLYFISSVLSFLIAKKFLQNKMGVHGVIYGILGIGMLLISFEEISWGQRIFNVTTPDYFKQHNIQNEISLHNLEIFHSRLLDIYILLGAYGSFTWILIKRLTQSVNASGRHLLFYLIPEWFISSYFFFTFVVYLLLGYICRPHAGSFVIWRDQEPAELLLSLGIVIFMIINLVRIKTSLTSGCSETALTSQP